MKVPLKCLLPVLTAFFSFASPGFEQALAQPSTFPIANQSGVLEVCGGFASDGTNYLAALVVGQATTASQIDAQLVSRTGTPIGTLVNVGSGKIVPPPWPQVAYGGGTFLEAWTDQTRTSGVDIFGQIISTGGAKSGSSFPLLASVGSYGFQNISAVGFAGGNFLAVWQDGDNHELYGQIVTTGGALSGSAFLISSYQWVGKYAAVASDGTNFLVVWQNDTNDNDYVTSGEFVSSSGTVGSPFQISQTSSLDAASLAIASDGTNYLVVWNRDTVHDANGNGLDWSLYGRFVSTGGALSASEQLLAGNPGSQTFASQKFPNLAFDGQNYLLVWTPDSGSAVGLSDANFLSGQFLERSGSAVGPNFAALPSMGTNKPVLATGLVFDGTRFVLAGAYGLPTPNAQGDFGGITYWQTWGAFLQTNPPTTIQFTASPTNGAPPLTVQFNSANMDSQGNSITDWNWNFGDGATSTAQNPSHVYTNSDTFNPSLIAINNLGAAVIGYGPQITTVTSSTNFAYMTNNGTITILDYTGSGEIVIIPSSINGLLVTGLGDYALNDYSLTSVTIPESITNIGVDVFGNNPLAGISVNSNNPAYVSVAGVLFDKGLTALIAYPVGNGATSYAIPTGVMSIEVGAFASCPSLTNVTIPNSVTSIGDGTFASCISLASVTIPYNVTNMGVDTFDSCTSLTTVTIPNSVTSIGDYMFNNCTSLATVTIPNSVTNIGSGAFQYCASLASVTIPNNVTGIGDSAFYSCASLASVTIPNSVTNIGAHAFDDCNSLVNVIIPNSVTSIGNNAFEYCFHLKSAFFQGNAPPNNGTVFNGDSAIVYYLPGTIGWSFSFGGVPIALWNPSVQTANSNFGVRTNRFGFNIAGTANIPIVVEASTGLVSSTWTPVLTATVTNGLIYFNDPQWTNYPGRFYRIRSP